MFSKYRKLILRKVNIACVRCEKPVLLREYLRHLHIVHDVIERCICIWCMEYTWVRGDSNNYIHGYMCLKGRIEEIKTKIQNERKMEKYNILLPKVKTTTTTTVAEVIETLHKGEEQVNIAASPEDVESLITNYLCNNKEMDGWYHTKRLRIHHLENHNRIADVDGTFYEGLDWPLPDWLKTITDGHKRRYFENKFEFDEKSGLEAFWVKVFYCNSGVRAYHVSIKYQLWSQFLNFLAENRDNIFYLPYWCLCSGGNEHHRYMNMYTMKRNNGEIMKGWRKIQSVTTSNGKHHYKFLKLIKNCQHLFNTIAYVSNDASQCSSEISKMNGVNEYAGDSSDYFAKKSNWLYES